MGDREVSAFLTSLAVERNVSASTQNQALAATLFLYREVLGVELAWLDDVVKAKRPVRVPAVLGRDEVRAVLGRLAGGDRLVCALLYGSGLRLLEARTLRVKDVDSGRGEITARSGKGRRTGGRSCRAPSRRHSRTILLGCARATSATSRGAPAASSFRLRSRESLPTRAATGAGSGSFPRRGSTRTPRRASAAATTSTRPSSSALSAKRSSPPVFRSARRVTHSATPSPRISWRMGTTYGRSRSDLART